MRATPDLSMVAEHLGLSVITIMPDDARSRGIVASAVRVLDAHDLAIRQIFVTDPYLAEEPKLVVIVDGTLPPGVVDESPLPAPGAANHPVRTSISRQSRYILRRARCGSANERASSRSMETTRSPFSRLSA